MLRLVTAIACLLASPVLAQSNCADREAVIAGLQGKYGEHLAGGGVQNSQRIYEVWFSEETGTWTILMTRADGVSCIMASGQNWREEVKPPDGVPG